MLKPFPYQDSHRVPWKYDVTLISTQIREEKVFSNIFSTLARLTKSGWCYTPKELEKDEERDWQEHNRASQE